MDKDRGRDKSRLYSDIFFFPYSERLSNSVNSQPIAPFTYNDPTTNQINTDYRLPIPNT